MTASDKTIAAINPNIIPTDCESYELVREQNVDLAGKREPSYCVMTGKSTNQATMREIYFRGFLLDFGWVSLGAPGSSRSRHIRMTSRAPTRTRGNSALL
jgi:hypothetical protein